MSVSLLSRRRWPNSPARARSSRTNLRSSARRPQPAPMARPDFFRNESGAPLRRPGKSETFSFWQTERSSLSAQASDPVFPDNWLRSGRYPSGSARHRPPRACPRTWEPECARVQVLGSVWINHPAKSENTPPPFGGGESFWRVFGVRLVLANVCGHAGAVGWPKKARAHRVLRSAMGPNLGGSGAVLNLCWQHVGNTANDT